jgi:hypothetical protein
MPYHEADPDDPSELVGAIVPGSETSDEEMAECFIEEFALLGFDEARILGLFRNTGYRATHRLWAERGERWVKERIAAVRASFSKTGTGTGTRSVVEG